MHDRVPDPNYGLLYRYNPDLQRVEYWCHLDKGGWHKSYKESLRDVTSRIADYETTWCEPYDD